MARGAPRWRQLTVRQQQARLRAAHAVSLQRADPQLSLGQAAQRAGTTPRTVLTYFGGSYTRDRGRYRVAAADREPFVMTILSVEEGTVERVVRGSHKRAWSAPTPGRSARRSAPATRPSCAASKGSGSPG